MAFSDIVDIAGLQQTIIEALLDEARAGRIGAITHTDDHKGIAWMLGVGVGFRNAEGVVPPVLVVASGEDIWEVPAGFPGMEELVRLLDAQWVEQERRKAAEREQRRAVVERERLTRALPRLAERIMATKKGE